MRVQLKTTKGERIDLNAREDTTIAQIRDYLVRECGYSSAVQVMFGGVIVDGNRFVDEFPFGSLMVVGPLRASVGVPAHATSMPPDTHHHHHHHQAGQQQPPVHVHRTHHHQPRPTSRPSPGTSPARNRGSDESPSQHGAQAHGASPARQAPAAAAPADGPGVSPRAVTPQPELPLRLRVIVPSDGNRLLNVELSTASSGEDLAVAVASLDPRYAGAKLVIRGKVVNPTLKLPQLGLRDGDAVFVAASSGPYADMLILALLGVCDDFERIRDRVAAAGAGMSESEKRMAHEELMRVLFRTDALQDLEGEWRAQRKEVVRALTSLQDSLKVEPY